MLSLIGLSPLSTSHPNSFQPKRVRTSTRCYPRFILLMDRSHSFASAATYFRPIQTRFRYGSGSENLSLACDEQLVGSLSKRHAVTAFAAPTVCKHTVSGTISLPSEGCFSPFPHGTCSLSVTIEYLALPDGPGGFKQDFSSPALLRILPRYLVFRVQGFHLLWLTFPRHSSIPHSRFWSPTTPVGYTYRFGLLPVRSPLLRESLLFSFPPGTKMFQFPGFAS